MSYGAVVAAAALGLALGAALRLPAYRLSVPMHEAPRTACARCATPLPAGAAGWLRVSGGRCPYCDARLGPRPLGPALLGAVVCAGLAWRFGASPALLPYLFVGLLGVLLGMVDLACRRLPDVLVLPGIAATALTYAAIAAGTGAWGQFGRALGGGAAMFGAYLVLAWLPGGQLGGGDVTLAGLLGLCLGWLGWPTVIAGAVLPFLVNAPVVLVLMIARRVGRRARVPFGPAMLAGAYLAVVGPVATRALLA